jgi:hypothetical protein
VAQIGAFDPEVFGVHRVFPLERVDRPGAAAKRRFQTIGTMSANLQAPSVAPGFFDHARFF